MGMSVDQMRIMKEALARTRSKAERELGLLILDPCCHSGRVSHRKIAEFKNDDSFIYCWDALVLTGLILWLIGSAEGLFLLQPGKVIRNAGFRRSELLHPAWDIFT